jgi:hypothetical protein
MPRPPIRRRWGLGALWFHTGRPGIRKLISGRYLKNVSSDSSKFSVEGVESKEEEAYRKLGTSHIQDDCYGDIENTKSAISPEQMARLSRSNKDTWHNTLVLPTFQGHRGQKFQYELRSHKLFCFRTITEERLVWLIQIFCGVGSLEVEEEVSKSRCHIQDGCYGGHIENSKSAITPEQMAWWVEIFTMDSL